jgi:alpha-L-fucosidase
MNSHTIQPGHSANAVQRAMINRRYGLFIHYGLNTFLNTEWSDGTHPPGDFAPAGLDTDDWAATAAEAGMRYVILTVKHHEGFCIWPSEHTDHAVRDVDVLGNLSLSCQKFGIELGLYYSLWDRHWEGGVMRELSPPALDEQASRRYVDHMLAQLTELFTRYGPVCELWLDGGWAQPRAFWRIPEIYARIKDLQPACALGVNWSIGLPGEPDMFWPDKPLEQLAGTRRGDGPPGVLPEEQRENFPIRYFPCDFRLGDPYLPGENDPKCFSHCGLSYYLPFESTVCLNERWFYSPDDTTLRSVDELAALYRRATAEDNVFILNSPPNREGVMPPQNRARLAELRKRIGLGGSPD